MFHFKPIGFIETPFLFKNGTPRQPTVCSLARGVITIDKAVFNNPEHSLEGLQEFSHVWIFFMFHKNNNKHYKAKVKPPRLNGRKVGVFSSRSPYRPNNIGLTLAKIESIEGAKVSVSGIDIVDGSPIVDLKPYIPQYDNPALWSQPGHVEKQREEGRSESQSISMQNTLQHLPVSSLEGSRMHGNCSKVSEAAWFDNLCKTHGKAAGEETFSVYDNAYCNDPASVTGQDGSQKSSLEADTTANRKTNPDRKLTKNESEPSQSNNMAYAADWVNNAPVTKLCVVFTPRAEEQLALFSKDSLEPGHQGGDRGNTSKHPQSLFCNEDTYEPHMSDTSNPVKRHSEKPTLRDSLLDKHSHSKQSTEKQLQKSFRKKSLQSPTIEKSQSHLSTAKLSQSYDVGSPGKPSIYFTGFSKRSSTNAEMSMSWPYKLQHLNSTDELRTAIVRVLEEDPRSVYRRMVCTDKLYYFTVDVVHVTCWFDDGCVEVVRLKPLAHMDKLTTWLYLPH
ncbi:tRNA (adenine(37)-N6)-methyltransferase-like [Dreissena polymorpha]|uniref:TsaA-like domain-containing protein n=1 Tax=Dreissena polymorpha TaxID=45954 RepID=A0A9D4HFZ5_DREPO|nr:tRNA (adenine(37)-N6)-methyltransferase-like [Dreissena polymorpha]XP_052246798.1 tRNA (adenine(37)-N6)-methyltransferase-like [Dreissena polymorpha]KAH3716164.1 hypothetical protein DPMN_058883 [Dreissena polymorpha]